MTLPALTPPPPPPPVRLPQPLAEVPAASASAFVLELLWAAVRDRVDPAHVAAALTAVPPTLASAASRLADAVWLVWLELDHASSGGEEDATSEDLRRKLVALTRALLAPPGVAAPTPSAPLTRALLLERCEGDFLESCGCVASAARFKKREVRFNTKRVYVQRKFNLLREESEGYAKLIAALAAIREGPEPPPPPEENNDDSAAEDADGKDAADERVSRVALRDSARAETLELIGAFDLDPNRALALILEALELAPTHRGLRDLLERFDREHVGQVLGFAFQRAAELSRADAAAASSSRGGGGVRTSFVRESEAGDPADDRGVVSEEEAEEEEEEEAEEGEAPPIAPESTPAASDEPAAASELSATPESLFALAAILARDGVVDASALYAHLSPPDDVARRRFVAATEARLAAARRVGVVSLVGGASGASDKETTDPASIAATPADGSWGGQKLGFLRAALEVGDEATGASVHARLVALGADPAEDPRVRDALLASARRALEAPYEALASPPGCRAAMRKRAAGKKADGGAPTDDGAAPPTDDVSDSAVDALFARLAALGPHLGRDVDAFVRSCRVVRAVLDRANRRNGDGDGDEGGDGDLSDEDDPPSSDRRKHGSRKRVRVRDWRLACERILATAILPALSLVEANPAAANEAWAALSLMPTEARYRVYAEWRSWYNGCEDTFALEDDDWKRPPEAPEDDDASDGAPGDAAGAAPGDSSASASASASTFAPAAPGPLTLPRPALVASSRVSIVATRRVLRRLSKDNAKPFGRALGKACHANPIPALSAVVSQIEAYTNMIEPVCASFAFLTRLGYDALTFVIVEKLAGGRAKLKSDGQHVSLWLQALASFCGHLARRYQDVDLASLLQYLANALKDDQSVDLLVLKELIARMTGCEALEDMSDAQIEAMAGGETLRQEAVVGAKGSVTTRQRLKGVARLRHALTRGPDPLAAPLLVLIAQRRQALAYEDDGGDDDFGGGGFGARRHLKLTSQLYDSCQETLFHYCDFLAAAYPDPREYAAMLPSLRELVHDHGIEPGIAFHVWRPVLRHLEPRARAEEDDAEEEKEEEKVAKVAGEDEGDDGTQKKDSVRTQKKKDEKDSNTDPNKPPTNASPDSNSNSPLLGLGLTWGELDDAARSMLPDDAWEAITPELYVTFWAGSLYDLDVPTARYDAETNACEAKIKALNHSEDAAEKDGGSRGGGRGGRPKDASSSAAVAASAKERKRERERLEGTLARLVAERDAQTSWTAKQSASLSAAKSRFFADPSPGQNVVIEKLLQHCVFPRLAHSPAEATFCARFFERLHAMDVPGFNTVLYLNQTFSPSLDRLIFTRTEYEANRLGRFLGDTLRLMERWRSDAAAYARECAGKEGFKAKQGTRDVTMDEFTQLAYKFHCRLSKAFMKCLEEEEYMAIRNVLAVGAKIVEHFPAVSRLGAHIMKRVDAVKTKDARGDIKTVATRYLAMLARKKKGWISDHAFNPIGCPPSEAEREAKEAELREEREREERKRKRLEREEQARKEREEREKSAGRGAVGGAEKNRRRRRGKEEGTGYRRGAGRSGDHRGGVGTRPIQGEPAAAILPRRGRDEADETLRGGGGVHPDEGEGTKGRRDRGEGRRRRRRKNPRVGRRQKKRRRQKRPRRPKRRRSQNRRGAARRVTPSRRISRARLRVTFSRERRLPRARPGARPGRRGRDRGGEKRRRDDRGEDDRGDGGRDDAKRRRGEGTGGGGGGGANDSPAVGRGGTRACASSPRARARGTRAGTGRAAEAGEAGGAAARGAAARGGGERGGGGGDRDRDRNVRGGGDERGGDRDRNVRGGGERAGGGGGRGARGRR